MKYLLTLSFLGTAYCGWQVQPNGLSVQQCVQQAAEQVFGCRCAITGCSRTDSGVHANMFCCTAEPLEGGNLIPIDRIPLVCNRYLPSDIAVRHAVCVPDDFHARYDVAWKEYEYLILNSSLRDPFWSDRAYLYPHRLDEKQLQKAAQTFVGQHDFAAFMAAGSSVTDTVRTIDSCEVMRQEDLIGIRIKGNGFLYHMVRILCGTLLAVAEGKIAERDLPEIIASRDRMRAGSTLPACGLYLNRVFYSPNSQSLPK